MAKATKKPVKKPVKKAKKVMALARRGPSAITAAPTLLTEEEVVEAFDMLGVTQKLTDPIRKKLFIKMALMNNLNPLKREIHAVERNVKTGEKDARGQDIWTKVLTPVTGYEVFIDRAELSGRLQYWYPVEEGVLDQNREEKDTYQVTIVIKRRDWPKEFRWTVKHAEVSLDNAMWKKEPSHMTMKVAVSRAFRLCFREILRGMPFTQEEEYTRAEYEERPAMQEPKALPVLDQGGKTTAAVSTEEEKQAEKEILAAQEELQTVYTKCFESKLFEKAELVVMMATAVAQKENLTSLRDLAISWQIELAERADKKVKGETK